MVPSVIEEGIDGAGENSQPGPSITRDVESTSLVTKVGPPSSPVQLAGPKAVTLTTSAVSLIAHSTRSSTKTKYNCIVRKWKDYCQQHQHSTVATTNTYANSNAMFTPVDWSPVLMTGERETRTRSPYCAAVIA